MAEELDPIKQVVHIDIKETGAGEATQDVAKLNATITQSTTAANKNANANEKLEESYKPLKSQLREANAELQKSIQLYGESSEQTIKAAKAVGDLKDQIGFAKDISEQFNPDQKFKALGAATQLGATGMQGLTAGMALFGDQSEDTEKALLQVQSAMAFSDAISGLSDLGDQWQLLKSAVTSSSIATKANTAATGAAAIIQKAFTGSVDNTSKGFKGLKLAIAGTGIGLLVTGLVALIQNFDKVKKVVLNFVPGLAAVGDQIMNIVESVTDFIGVTSEADRAMDKMISNADKSLAKNKKFLAEHGSQLDEYSKQKIEVVNEYNEALKEAGADQQALALEANRKLAAIDKARQDEIDKNRAEAAEKEKQRLEKLRKEEEDRLAKEKAEREKQEAENKRNAEFISGVFKKIEEDKKKAKEEADKAYQDSLDANIEAQKKAFEEQKRLEEEAFAESQRISEAKLAQEKAIQSSRVSLVENGINFLKQIAGKNKTLQRGIIIAESALGIGRTVVAAQTANATATAEGAALAIPTAGASVAAAAGIVTANSISAGIGIAANLAATAKALSAVGGSGGGSPSAGGATATPTPSRNVAQVGFQGSSENQISTAIAQKNKEQPPIQAFVVSQSVTDQQELDRKKELNNSF